MGGQIFSAMVSAIVMSIPLYLVFGVLVPWRAKKREEKRQRDELAYTAALRQAQGD